MGNRPMAYLAMLAAVVGWGFSTSFIEFGLEYLEPAPYLFYRFLLTTVVISFVLLPTRYQEIKKLLRMRITWIIGLSEFSGLAFQFVAISYKISAGLASLISLLFLIIVPFLSASILDDSINPKHMVSVLLAIAGMLLITTEGDLSTFGGGSLLAILLLLISAFSYGVYVVFTSKLSTQVRPETDTLALFYVVMLIISVMSMLMSIISGGVPIPSYEGWKWIFYIVFIATIVPFIGYFYAMRYISANLASVLLLGQVFVPFYIDIFYLGVLYTAWVQAGIFLVLVALVFAVIVDDGEGIVDGSELVGGTSGD